MISQDFQTNILIMLTDVDSAICLFGGILLLVRGKNNRARRMLSYTMLLWGVCSVVRALVLQAGLMPLLLHPMRPIGIIGGNVFVLLMLLFPLEVMLPGWLTGRRLMILLSPVIVLTAIYIGVLCVLGQRMEELGSISQFFTSFGHFNVWFRLLFLLLVMLYDIFLLRLVYRNEKKYIRWKNDNYADVDYMDISWMRHYAICSTAIFATWMLNVFVAYTWNFILSTVITIVSFGYVIYKGLFYESAYPEDFFRCVNGSPLNASVNECENQFGDECETIEEDNLSLISFEEKMPYYVETFTIWMEKEKPYLYKDFKLTDVSRVLPLNRSYLSRVLNEGLGMNFCQVVRKYRVEAAKTLLRQNPDLPIYEVAERCGFSSDTTFIRAFQKEMNVTPLKYRSEV